MDKRVRMAVAILDQNYAAGANFCALADALGVGLSRLEHLFKRDTGRSMREYVRERRLREGARLLATTRMRINEVGLAVGFPDPANFTHAFKELFGVCPREYRIDAKFEQLPPNGDDSHQVRGN
jgi:AraC family transcriptional regulator of arabinose operon